MGPDSSVWYAELLRGGVAGAAFVLLFLSARLRWKRREDPDATHADVGLD